MAINVQNVERFKFIAHKIIPLVYDDSLSYYEFLCKVMQKLNEVISSLDNQNEILKAFEVDLSGYVTADALEGYVTDAEMAAHVPNMSLLPDGSVSGAFLNAYTVPLSALYLDGINMPIAAYLTNTDPAQYPASLTAGAGRMFTTKYGDVFISEAAVTGPDDVLLLYDAAAAMRKVRTVADIEVADPITITEWTEGKKTNYGDGGTLTDDANMKTSGKLPTVVGVTYTFTCDMPGAYVVDVFNGEYPFNYNDETYNVTFEQLDFSMDPGTTWCLVVAPIGATVTYNVGTTAAETVSVTLTNRHEYRFSGEGTFHLQINKPSVTDAELTSSVHFTSPALAASISYADTILWHGDDVAGGVFVPKANTRYLIDFRYDGAYMTAEATAYTLPTA